MSITAQRIKSLRQANNITQQELANKINSSRTNIARIETDKVKPSYAMLSLISDVFGVPVEYLQGKISPFSVRDQFVNENTLYEDENGELFRFAGKIQNEPLSTDDIESTNLFYDDGSLFINKLNSDDIVKLHSYAEFLKSKHSDNDTSSK